LKAKRAGLFSLRSHQILVLALFLVQKLRERQHQSPNQQLVLIWDGASYHRSEELRAYLNQVNADKPEAEWQIRCIAFAPNAPEQNPIEDIWLQAKTYLRQHYYRCETFAQVKQLFVQFLESYTFDFPKLRRYG